MPTPHSRHRSPRALLAGCLLAATLGGCATPGDTTERTMLAQDVGTRMGLPVPARPTSTPAQAPARSCSPDCLGLCCPR